MLIICLNRKSNSLLGHDITILMYFIPERHLDFLARYSSDLLILLDRDFLRSVVEVPCVRPPTDGHVLSFPFQPSRAKMTRRFPSGRRPRAYVLTRPMSSSHIAANHLHSASVLVLNFFVGREEKRSIVRAYVRGSGLFRLIFCCWILRKGPILTRIALGLPGPGISASRRR
jgi:hypothetical protein